MANMTLGVILAFLQQDTAFIQIHPKKEGVALLSSMMGWLHQWAREGLQLQILWNAVMPLGHGVPQPPSL